MFYTHLIEIVISAQLFRTVEKLSWHRNIGCKAILLSELAFCTTINLDDQLMEILCFRLD
jgi:hypothetical protein